MPHPVRRALRGRPRGPIGSPMRSRTARLAGLAVRASALAAVLVVTAAAPALALETATSFSSVIDNLRNWLVGILAAVATLFLTIGGLRYLTAGGDPVQVERAKTALKSAAIGYALAALAPLLVSVLAQVVASRPSHGRACLLLAAPAVLAGARWPSLPTQPWPARPSPLCQ